MLMIPDENFLKHSGSKNLFETPTPNCYPMQSTRIYAKTSPSLSSINVPQLNTHVNATCTAEKVDLSLPNKLTFLAKDSGIDDCFEEEDLSSLHPKTSNLSVDDDKELKRLSEAKVNCVTEQQQLGSNCYAILCFLPDLAGFKGIILSQSPSQSTSPEIASKIYECYLKRLLNPLWRHPVHSRDEQEQPHDHVITNCYPNHVVIGKRIWENDPSQPQIVITDGERKSRFSLPTILPSMVNMSNRSPMLTISEQVDSGLEPCGDNVDDECLSMKLEIKREGKDVLPDCAVTDDQFIAPKEIIFSLEALEHDTNHNLDMGNVTLSLSPQQATQSIFITPTTSSIPNQQPLSTNPDNDDGNERHRHIQELLISHPQLFHESISSPELSSMYRAKRISHGDILASTLSHLALVGPNVAFRTKHLYKSDRANLIIARSLSKDLVDKGCFVCAGPITINFPTSLMSPLAPNECKLSNALPDKDTLGMEKLTTRKKRFPNFLANYNACTPQNNSLKYSPNREEAYDLNDNLFYPYL